jgi:hypothetical protein
MRLYVLVCGWVWESANIYQYVCDCEGEREGELKA